MKAGDKGADVYEFQSALIALGFPLPRWGADGHFGDETLDAWRDYQQAGGIEDPSDEVHPAQLENVTRRALGMYETGSDLVRDVRHEADAGRRRRHNPIDRVDTIVLHQMAVKDSDLQGWKRWRSLKIHYVVTEGENSRCYWMHDARWRMGHAHGFNSRSVGFELEGYFAGIEGDHKTFWKPKSRPNRKPMALHPAQAEAALAGVRHAIREVAKAGGCIEYIAAHRQSYGTKTSDPGEAIWRAVALPLIAEGLVEQFPGTLGTGRDIPEAWGGKPGVAYR